MDIFGMTGRFFIFALLLTSAALPAQDARDSASLRALDRWSRAYRSHRIRFSLESHYMQYACARASIMRPLAGAKDRKILAGPREIVHRFRLYRLGKIDGLDLARFIMGKQHVRKIDNLESLAGLLVTFRRAALAEAPGEVQKETARQFLRIATHTFGVDLAAEGGRWGVTRKYHPNLVRSEARKYLTVLAGRSAPVRGLLLDVARERIAFKEARMHPGEVALACLAGLDFSTLVENDIYLLSRTLTDIVSGGRNFWIRLAAARLLSGFGSRYHGRILAMNLEAVARHHEEKAASPGARVGLAVVEASGVHLARAGKAGRFHVKWADVPRTLKALVGELLRCLGNEGLPLELRLRVLSALESAGHWHVVHALVKVFPGVSPEGLKAGVYRTLQRLTRHRESEPEAWLRWYAWHRAEHDGAVEASRYAAPEAVRFYGIPIVGDRILFVVDTSGSMADPLALRPTNQQDRFSKIGRTRTELIKTIEALNDHKRFNAIFFDDSVHALFKELVLATRENRLKAVTRIKGLSGSGWTDFGAAVLAAFGKRRMGEAIPLPRAPDTVRHASTRRRILPDQIVLLSDGMPSKGQLFLPVDTVEEINRLNRALDIRIDAVALGHESDPFLLEEIARENRGVLVVFPEAFADYYRKFKAEMK